MGQKKQEEHQHHPTVDSLVALFTKAHHDLSLLHFKLDKEFQQIYPDNANPMKLVARIKKIDDELSSLKDECRQLLLAKQVFPQNWDQTSLPDYGSGSGFQGRNTPISGESIDQNEFDEDEDVDDKEKEDVDDKDKEDVDDKDNEDELNDEFIVQPIQMLHSLQHGTPINVSKNGSGNNNTAWSFRENEVLISCYMSISSEAAIGTNQSKESFWARVIAKYEEVRAADPTDMVYRTPSMIRSKWSRILKAIMKWVACYDEACARKKSGQSKDDWIKEAQKIWSGANKGKRFTMLEEWSILQRHPNWKPLVSMSFENVIPRGRPSKQTSVSESSGKRVREEDEYDEFVEMLETPSMVRGEGVKKAKARLRGKAKGKVEGAIDAFESFSEKIRIPNNSRQLDLAIERKHIELARKREARKERQTNWEMLQALKNNPNREGYEEEMLEQLKDYFRKKSYLI